MLIVRYIFLLFLGSANVILHSIGCILMIIHHRRQDSDLPSNLLLINLSISEILKNIAFILTNTLVGFIDNKFERGIICTFVWNFNLMYFCSMFLLTGDRLLAALLNLKYRVYCTYQRGKNTIICQWTFGGILIGLSFKFQWFNDFVPASGFIVVPLSIAYLIFAITTYCFIFRIFVRSSRIMSQNNRNISSFQKFRQSKFYVSVLLITSYMTFVILPDIFAYTTVVISKSRSIKLIAIWVLLREFSDICDWCIYVFARNPIRQLLYANMCRCCLKKERKEGSSAVIVSNC